MTTLNLELISHSFTQPQGNPLCLFEQVSFTFEQPKSYAIMGSSGSGKSTLLHILAGFVSPTHGQVLLNNQPISPFSMDQKAHFLHKTVGIVLQRPYLIKELNVVENVMIKGAIAGMSLDAAQEKAYQLLCQVGLEDTAFRSITTLSGGQQQRVAIVRALFNEPTFLLADEPTGNLDGATAHSLIDFLLDCQHQWHTGLILSTHDVTVAARMEMVLEIHQGGVRMRKMGIMDQMSKEINGPQPQGWVKTNVRMFREPQHERLTGN